MTEREWWTAREVAEHYAVSQRAVYEWAHDPDLIRMGGIMRVGRTVRYHAPTVARWIRERTLRDAPLAAVDEKARRLAEQEQSRRRGRRPKWEIWEEGRVAG